MYKLKRYRSATVLEVLTSLIDNKLLRQFRHKWRSHHVGDFAALIIS
jgi:hypothetical protein